jgi:hypothetical protein
LNKNSFCILILALFSFVGEIKSLNGFAIANSLEHEVKATFIYKFIHFIEWPKSGNASSEITIGVLGNSPIWNTLNEIKKEEDPDNKIKLFQIKALTEVTDYTILFFSPNEKPRFKKLLADLEGRPTLTISETKGFSDMGGQINFYLENDKVRFEINVESAKRSNLKISSKLLRLAKIVQNSN